MPSLRVIRKRIASVKSTEKITRAMKMVAGARLNRAQQRITALRPYAVKTGEILQSVAASITSTEADGQRDEVSVSKNGDFAHPLLARRPEKAVLFVVLTSDRGLCGAFNTNINKATEKAWKVRKDAGVEVAFATIGRKGREYLARRNATIARDFPRLYDGLDDASGLAKARLVTSWLVPQFEKKEVDAIYLVYNEFKSALTQHVVLEPLLPLKEAAKPVDASAGGSTSASVGSQGAAEFLFEPNARALLERLVPMYVEISLHRALLESQASEFGARMTAMDSATRNAKKKIAQLTLAYNRARQAAITKELMEIIGGAEALKE